MINRIRTLFISTLMLLLMLNVNTAIAKGSQLKFSSVVSAIVLETGSDTNGVLIISVHGIEVPVNVNGDTEIESSGEEISLVDIEVGDFVRVNAFFFSEGISAEGILVLDQREEQFRFRGAIAGLSTIEEITTLTIMGVDILLDGDTKITRRGSGQGNSVSGVDLNLGDEVNIRGEATLAGLHARTVHVGTRQQGNIELEGVIVSLGDGFVEIEIDGSGIVSIVIDENTSISGELALGVFIELEGQLNTELAVIAFEIVADTDGDGDADDDNDRGERGDHRSENGKNNANNNKDKDKEHDDAEDEDEGNDEASDDELVLIEAEIALDSETEIQSFAEYRYKQQGDDIEQSFNVTLKHAEPETTFTLVVLLGEDVIEFGQLTSNGDGQAGLEFSFPDVDGNGSLQQLLPEGKDVRDISSVKILLEGDVVSEGSF